MKKRSVGNLCKNALGTVLLLVGAFFVCSTLLSMRVVFADPIGPVFGNETGATQSAASPRTSGRTNPRGGATSARPTTATSTSGVANASRGVATRNVSARQTNPARTTTTRNVVSRTTTNRATANRNVRSRTATTTAARISLEGDPIRGAKNKNNSTYYTYLNGKLYSGNYSNIIDSTTGLISADAYSNCLESYYTCMDEICTARNAAQRRCACAGRVKAFAEAEDKLESANEELIKVSGELALLIANKGKEVSSAFSLTDAEKVMNCASWREASRNKTATEEQFGTWCEDHGIYDSNSCGINEAPSYCSNESVYGFNVENLDGAGSDILASLAQWADNVKGNVDTILTNKDDNVFAAISTLTGVINGITGSTASLYETETVDTLAETWGYDLFRYAHNNVCARVLDSCFNGIYEACGTPPSDGRCANGATSSCPFNYNSKVEIESNGNIKLNERGSGTATANASASCFGYTSSSGDPYSSLRGPVADARRSVMQKYLLDANADCDLYGEQLKTTAQKISYQKVAAQQALQQKRLEFYNEEQESVLSAAIAAGTNFSECVSELYDCYETQDSAHEDWSTSRIKTYCAQIANAPHCYQDMICNPSAAQFKAIIDVADSTSCTWHPSDYKQNTCRNVVTLNEILNRASDNPSTPGVGVLKNGNSAAFREQCLRDALGCGTDGTSGCIRSWTK